MLFFYAKNADIEHQACNIDYNYMYKNVRNNGRSKHFYLYLEQGEHFVANQFLNLDLLEYGVANSCESVSNQGAVGTSAC